MLPASSQPTAATLLDSINRQLTIISILPPSASGTTNNTPSSFALLRGIVLILQVIVLADEADYQHPLPDAGAPELPDVSAKDIAQSAAERIARQPVCEILSFV